FGLAPALHASRADVNEVIKHGGRGIGGSSGGRLRAAIIVFETAAAVVLVIGAGLLIRSFAALSRVDLGFRTEQLLVVDTSVPAGGSDGARAAIRFYQQLLPQLGGIPGVRAVGAVRGVPTVVRSNGGYAIDRGPTLEDLGIRSQQATFTTCSPGYLGTLGIPLVEGRDFTDADVEGAPLVAIVNQALARQSFAGENPI